MRRDDICIYVSPADREVERKIVREQPVPELRLGLRDDLVRLRHFLNVVYAGADRIEIGLRRSDLEHVQDNLRILRIVLVPAVVQSFSRTGQRNRGHQPECDAGFEQPGLPDAGGVRCGVDGTTGRRHRPGRLSRPSCSVASRTSLRRR